MPPFRPGPNNHLLRERARDVIKPVCAVNTADEAIGCGWTVHGELLFGRAREESTRSSSSSFSAVDAVMAVSKSERRGLEGIDSASERAHVDPEDNGLLRTGIRAGCGILFCWRVLG